jgi:uncharacterized Zn ribbon protein
MSYERKYLKYKNKYLSLKNSYLLQMGGGGLVLAQPNIEIGDIVSLNSNPIIKGTIVKTYDDDNWADMIGYNGKKYSNSYDKLTKIRDPLKVGDTVQLLSLLSTPPGMIDSIDANKINCGMRNSIDSFPTRIWELIKPENMSDYTSMKDFEDEFKIGTKVQLIKDPSMKDFEDEFKIGTKVQLIKDPSIKGIITKKDGNNITILSQNNQAYSGDKSKFLRSMEEIIINKSSSLKKGNLVQSMKDPNIKGIVVNIDTHPKNKNYISITVKNIKTNELDSGFAHNFRKVDEPRMI